ncbi:MAG: short-chain dehydrogenase [Deltaproteobacteria bacterium]|nr:short-chain dehydrogenase [Deltaproteobacteria bacterium]
MILEGKTVLVSGVGPGLGGEVARVAKRDGARVLIGARNESRLQEIAKGIDPEGQSVVACPVDVTDKAACAHFVETAEERFGGVDALVSVAALDTLFGNLETTTAEDWQGTIGVNVIGTLQLVQAAVPAMKRRGGGSVVLIGSQSYRLPPPNKQLAYASSKGALISAMYHLASELGPDRIRVNTVVPTWMWGPPVQMYVKWQAKERGVSEDEIKGEITSGMPLGEIPADDDVAEAVAFFCSDRARLITAQTLAVDSGEVMG